MALIMLAGAGYAYYAASKQAEDITKLYPIDPDLDFDNKSCIEFLPLEIKSNLFTNALTTITFYNGDYRTINETIKNQVDKILHENPFLGGRLAIKPEEMTIKLWYDPDGVDYAPNIYTCYNPGEIPLKRNTKYVQYKDLIADFKVKVPAGKSALINKNQCLWKVTIVPDAVDHYQKFALIVSMSHLLGDAYTYYKILKMLSPNAVIERLNPTRHVNFRIEVEKHMGIEEAHYIEKTSLDMIDQMLANHNKDKEEQKRDTMLFTISNDWLDYQTKKNQMDIKQKKEDQVNEDDVSKTPIRPAEIILSWWYNISNADIGMYPHQLRNDLTILSENDAGNYNNPIPYTKTDYTTPQLIHDSILKGKRCGYITTSTSSSSSTKTLTALPKITTGKTFAMGVDWSQHFSTGFDFTNNPNSIIEEELHIPLFAPEDLLALPSKVCCLILFTAQTGTQLPGSSSTKDDLQRQKIGVFIVAKKEILDRIQASGIVDEDMNSNKTNNIVNKRGSMIEFDEMPDLSSLGLQVPLDDEVTSAPILNQENDTTGDTT